MSIRLLVAGRRSGDSSLSDQDMDDVSRTFHSTVTHVLARCDTPGDLVHVVQSVAAEHGPIGVLDLYDHGGPGHLWLGDAWVFASDDDPSSELLGRPIASAIATHLEDTAHVRLLGCQTGTDTASRLLLVKLARALGGHRTAFGTITMVDTIHFSSFGFRPGLEDSFLFSSLAALDGPSSGITAREASLADVRPLQCSSDLT